MTLASDAVRGETRIDGASSAAPWRRSRTTRTTSTPDDLPPDAPLSSVSAPVFGLGETMQFAIALPDDHRVRDVPELSRAVLRAAGRGMAEIDGRPRAPRRRCPTTSGDAEAATTPLGSQAWTYRPRPVLRPSAPSATSEASVGGTGSSSARAMATATSSPM
jgi:hypothetical protein